MKNIQIEILINSHISKVWDVLMNFENFSKWNPFIKSISGEQKTAKTLTVSIQPPDGTGMTFKPIILTMEQHKEFRWKGKLGITGIFDGEHYFILESVDNAASHFFLLPNIQLYIFCTYRTSVLFFTNIYFELFYFKISKLQTLECRTKQYCFCSGDFDYQLYPV